MGKEQVDVVNLADDKEIGVDTRLGMPSIAVNHTPPAARLLLVRSIRKLASGIVMQEKIKLEKYQEAYCDYMAEERA